MEGLNKICYYVRKLRNIFLKKLPDKRDVVNEIFNGLIYSFDMMLYENKAGNTKRYAFKKNICTNSLLKKIKELPDNYDNENLTKKLIEIDIDLLNLQWNLTSTRKSLKKIIKRLDSPE